MPFGRLKEFGYFLRFRLAVWYGGVFVGLVVVALLIVHEGSRYTIIEETDERLSEDAKETAQAVAELYPRVDQIETMLARKADSHTHERLFLQWLEPDGDIAWQSKETPAHLSDDLGDVAGVPGVYPIREVGVFRVAQQFVDAPKVPRYLVRVGASQEQINAAVWRRTSLMMITGALVLILAPLGGYWIAGSAIAPLTDIISTAGRLQPTRMDDRLPIRGTGDELDKLSGTINKFLDRIGEYLRSNREFVANAAHELRSPLAAILSSVDVALGTPRSTHEYENLLEVIADECSQLATLVNQLLLLAESDAGRILRNMEDLRLDRLVETSIEMFRGVTEERGITLETEFRDEGLVHADAARLRQVINNLVDNGIKYTPTGGRVRVEVARIGPDRDGSDRNNTDRNGVDRNNTDRNGTDRKGAEDRVTLRVIDTGSGIPKHDLPHVFERFYRGDKGRERESANRGTGLGLAITRAIVQAHDGEITVESELGRGTTFTITLPAAKPAGGKPSTHPEPPPLPAATIH